MLPINVFLSSLNARFILALLMFAFLHKKTNTIVFIICFLQFAKPVLIFSITVFDIAEKSSLSIHPHICIFI